MGASDRSGRTVAPRALSPGGMGGRYRIRRQQVEWCSRYWIHAQSWCHQGGHRNRNAVTLKGAFRRKINKKTWLQFPSYSLACTHSSSLYLSPCKLYRAPVIFYPKRVTHFYLASCRGTLSRGSIKMPGPGWRADCRAACYTPSNDDASVL